MTARIYVGTYAKYTNGSIKGAWLELEDYSDHEAFITACKALHADEQDPELMFQDFEGFPKSFYGESYIKPELWDWLELDENDRQLLAVYNDELGCDGDIDAARDAFCGKYDSEADWAEEFLEDTGGLEGVPERLKSYIDYEAYGRDARLGGGMRFVHVEGELWAFYNH